MRTETVRNVTLPKIGFGTWAIGGRSTPEPSSDKAALAALRSALELGYTHFDTAESYAAGHTEELLGRAIRESGIAREDLFITSKVSPEHLRYKDVLRACENSLRRLGVDYLDLYLIHWPSAHMDLPGSFRALNELVRAGKVRHLGVSNFDLPLLEQSVALAETPLLTNQVPYHLADRSYAENGVLDYCQQNDILLTAYSPIRRLDERSQQAVQAVAEARGATPAQIALAWVISQPRVITIPKAVDPAHQAENLAAGDIELTAEEMDRLNRAVGMRL